MDGINKMFFVDIAVCLSYDDCKEELITCAPFIYHHMLLCLNIVTLLSMQVKI